MATGCRTRSRATCAASTRAVMLSTTRFLPCINRCAARTPTRLCTGSCACSTGAPIPSTSAGAWSGWRSRTSALPTRVRCGSRSTPARLTSACAAKSNAVYDAYNRARDFVAEDESRPVPERLRNAPTKLMKELGFGKDYRYAHDESDAYAAGENYFPEGMPDVRWYEPTDRGLEDKIREKMKELRRRDDAATKK